MYVLLRRFPLLAGTKGVWEGDPMIHMKLQRDLGAETREGEGPR